MKERGNQGFTLLELMLVLALISTIIGMGYSLYFTTVKSVDQAQDNWTKRAELDRAGNYINNELRHAFKLEISNYNQADFSNTDDSDNYLYINDDKELIHKQGEEKKYVLRRGENYGYQIIFTRVRGENDDLLNHTAEYTLWPDNQDKEKGINSKITLNNIPPQSSIKGEEGNLVYYKKSPETGKIPAADFSTYCFIATTIYQNENHPALTLLRTFRDRVLYKLPGGKKFIANYYKYGPRLSNIVDRYEIIKLSGKILILPILGFSLLLTFPYKIIPLYLLLFVFIEVINQILKNNLTLKEDKYYDSGVGK